MLVTLAGLGCGTAATVTAEAREALLRADCLIGAERLLAALPETCAGTRLPAVTPQEILRLLEACLRYDVPAIVAMGRKGGSTVAAAICSALLYTAADMLDPGDRGWQ